jgi:hypothetical protein
VRRWLLFIATLWPIAYMLLFILVVGVSTVQGGGDPDNDPFLIPFGLLIALHLGTMLVVVGLLVVYIIDVFRNPRLEETHRVLWAIVLFMGNAIAMPVYWWLYMRPRPAV